MTTDRSASAPSGAVDPYAQVAALLPSAARRTDTARAVLADHLAEHPGYVAWSGGRDSTCVMLLAVQIDPDVPVVWFDSGLEFPENRAYIEQVANAWKVNLTVLPAQPDALTILARTGAWDHTAVFAAHDDPGLMHRALVTGPARIAHARFGAGEVLGLRAGESVGRRILLASGSGRYTRADGSQVCAPIWRWSATDVVGFLARERVPENPVYGRLRELGAPEHAQRVGLMVDGNAAEYGRYTWLRAGWPQVWEDLCSVLPRLREWR